MAVAVGVALAPLITSLLALTVAGVALLFVLAGLLRSFRRQPRAWAVLFVFPAGVLWLVSRANFTASGAATDPNATSQAPYWIVGTVALIGLVQIIVAVRARRGRLITDPASAIARRP